MHENSVELIKYIPYIGLLPNHVGTLLLVGFLLWLAGWAIRVQISRQLNRIKVGHEDLIAPEVKLSLKNVFEVLAESLYRLAESIIGKQQASKYFPCIGVLFVVIVLSNLIGLIPGFEPPTGNLNTTLALGCFVFFYYHFVGFKTQGLHYIKHFLGPLIWLSPLMFVIEVVSHLFRPVSLALRLRGNIFGDHIVLSVFSHLAPYIIPTIFYGLGVFVALMQGFVFCVMTMIYISLSISHDH